MHWTASAASRSAAASSMRLPSVSILSATPAAARMLEELPAVRHAERLAAAEGDVGDAEVDDAPREVERLVAASARRARPCRGRTPRSRRGSARVQRLVSCQARKGAPGTRRPSAPASRKVRQYQVKRMYGCAITCSETSSIFGVSQCCLSLGGGLRRDRLAAAVLRRLDRQLRFAHRVSPSVTALTTRQQLPACWLARDAPRPRSRRACRRDHCSTPPGVAIGVPGLRKRSLAQIGADVRQRRRHLDPAVGQHEQRRRRLREARAQAVLDARRARGRAPCRLDAPASRASSARNSRVLRLGVGSSLSHSRAAVPMRISRPVLKRKAPSARARSMTASASCRLRRVGANVISSGRPASRTARQAACAFASEPPGRWRCVDLLRVAVEAHLDRADRQAARAVARSPHRSAGRWSRS